MQNHSSLIESNRWGFVLAACCLFIICLANNFQLSDGVLSDPFHQGEYFAALATLLDDQVSFHPVIIHGALDYIPGLIALNIFGENNYFFTTSLLYQLLNFLSAIIFLAVVYEIIKYKPKSTVVLLASALAIPFLVGYRDTVLLLSIYFYFLIQKNNQPVVTLFLEICFGLTVAFGLFWAFDRGIAGTISLGIACIIHAYKNRLYLVSLVIFFVTIISLGYVSPQFSLGNYLENIKLLTETSYQWSYGWRINAIILTGFLVFSNILTIFLLASLIINNSRISNNILANSLFLIILSLFLLKIGSNRADMIHIQWGLWGPLLSSFYWYSKDQNVKLDLSLQIALGILLCFILILDYYCRSVAFIPITVLVSLSILIGYSGTRYFAINKLISAILIIPLFAAIYSISNGLSSGKYLWIKYLGSPPSNSELVTPGVRWVSQELINSGSRCVFDLSNNGVINGLTGLPTCSRFSYLVYADQRYEQEIIDSLRKKKPKAIVYSSTYWSFSIDGKKMHARFPDLDKFIIKEYTKEKCSIGYCVRYLEAR